MLRLQWRYRDRKRYGAKSAEERLASTLTLGWGGHTCMSLGHGRDCADADGECSSGESVISTGTRCACRMVLPMSATLSYRCCVRCTARCALYCQVCVVLPGA